MQPTYLYPSDFYREIEWRSSFSAGPVFLLGLFQMFLATAIVALEIASVIISPVYSTLYAGFWCSVIFALSWISMFGLICCHRARNWSIYMLLVSVLCACAAITIIVLDALFIANIEKCFFASVVCDELKLSFPQVNRPLETKLPILKGQLASAALMLATALLYILLFICSGMSTRHRTNRILIEDNQLPVQIIRQYNTRTPTPEYVNRTHKYLECPHCQSTIKISSKKRREHSY